MTLFPGTRLDQRAQRRSALEARIMSGSMSKYILEEYEVECIYPDIGHCPIKCMSRSYAHMFLRFQNLEESIKEIKHTLNTVMDYVIRGVKSSSSSDSDKARDKKKAKKGKKSRAGSRSGSDVIDQDMLDVQATLERDFSQLLTWKSVDDEGGKPKKPKCCPVILMSGPSTSTSSNDGDTSERETSGDEHQSGAATEADDIVRKVSQVINNMAKVVDELQATAGIAEQLAADVTEMQAQIDDNDGQSAEEEETDEPEYAGDFFALNNEMNEVD